MNQRTKEAQPIIKIIDYKAGNAPSVLHATTHLGYEANLARTPHDLADATHIILPGVGSARATMESLQEMGMIEALEEAVLRKQTLFLGICVGMQILFEHSEEENAKCLGWLKGRVVRFDSAKVRVPQMGWNCVRFKKSSGVGGMPLFAADSENREDFFYFVNSYYARPDDETNVWGVADYGETFTAAVCRDNIYGTQFHIEKSGEAGLALLNQFINFVNRPAK